MRLTVAAVVESVAAFAFLASCGGAPSPSETPKVDVTVPTPALVDAGGWVEVDAGVPMTPLVPIPRIGEAAVPFAHYAVAMHKRIHPIFTDQFLSSLDQLPPTNPMNDMRIATTLEIVLNRDGTVDKVGILRSSGVTAFDIAAIDSVQRAQPFGNAPDAIVSFDDRVHARWEFHRDPVIGCSTVNTWPIMLRSAPNH
jgi:TonB family protein